MTVLDMSGVAQSLCLDIAASAAEAYAFCTYFTFFCIFVMHDFLEMDC